MVRNERHASFGEPRGLSPDPLGNPHGRPRLGMLSSPGSAILRSWWYIPVLAAYLSAHRTMINGSALCAALAVTERD
jgi:hypothetical protein